MEKHRLLKLNGLQDPEGLITAADIGWKSPWTRCFRSLGYLAKCFVDTRVERNGDILSTGIEDPCVSSRRNSTVPVKPGSSQDNLRDSPGDLSEF